MRQKQLHGVAKGLKYLHGANLVHGDLKGVSAVSSCEMIFFLTCNRRISSCPMTTHHVPALRTSGQRSLTLSTRGHAARNWRAPRGRTWLRNSCYPAGLALQNQYPRRIQTFTRSDWLSTRYETTILGICVCLHYSGSHGRCPIPWPSHIGNSNKRS